jgi:hypothetical protein
VIIKAGRSAIESKKNRLLSALLPVPLNLTKLRSPYRERRAQFRRREEGTRKGLAATTCSYRDSLPCAAVIDGQSPQPDAGLPVTPTYYTTEYNLSLRFNWRRFQINPSRSPEASKSECDVEMKE